MKLEFGCGPSLTKGYVGVDIRKLPGIEYICNAWEIDQHVDPESVEAIRSRHFLEHLTYPQVDKTLSAWWDVLKPGGRVITMVPDLSYHFSQFVDKNRQTKKSEANPNWTLQQHAIAGIYGWQREADETLWDVHKSGWDETILTEYLTKHGFVGIQKIEEKPWNLYMEAYKE